MIRLSTLPCDEFRVNAYDYENNPSATDVVKIRLIEQEIINKTSDFLSDPAWHINEWEELTGEAMPEQYLKDIPTEISGFLYDGKTPNRMKRVGYTLSYLPVMKGGKVVSYPEDRMVEDFTSAHHRVYILKDDLYKKLVAA